MFTTARHWYLSWIRSTHSTPSHTVSPRFTLILFSHLRLGLPSALFPSGFQSKILCTFPIFLMRAVCLVHLILLDLISLIIFGEEHKSYEDPHYAVFSRLPRLSPYYVQTFSSEPCSQTLSIYAPLLMWEIKFHTPTKQQVNYGKVKIFLNISVFSSLVLGKGRIFSFRWGALTSKIMILWTFKFLSLIVRALWKNLMSCHLEANLTQVEE